MLAGQRCLITGGGGLIGSHIADALAAEQAAEIVVLDSFVRGSRENLKGAVARGNVSVIEGDIRDRHLLSRAFKGIDVVFHQAAIRITQCAEEPRLAFEVLAEGTFNVLEAAVAAQVRKVVLASSASVYGMAEEFPTTERHHTYNNDTLYGAAKSFNEGLLSSFRDMYGLDSVALRYFNVYGPRMDVAGAYTEVFIRWMERIHAGRAPLIFGDGKQTMDFVYVEDLARANILAAKRGGSADVFNVASGVETRLAELARKLLRLMGSDLPIEFAPERQVNSVRRRIADTSRATQMLGFETQIDLDEGLKRLIQWWTEARQKQESVSV